MFSSVKATALAALIYATHTSAVEYQGIIDGGVSPAVRDYAYANLPHRNSTTGLLYLPFNWTDPAKDNGIWTLRLNTDDAWLPSNISAPGAEKIVVTSYALQWSGSNTYKNLSSKVWNDTDTLRKADLIPNNTSPSFCLSFMASTSDFDSSVTQNMYTPAEDPCVSLLGQQCLDSLTAAWTSAFSANNRTCAPTIPSANLAGCENTWAKKVGGGSQWDSTLLVNGSQAGNASYLSPAYDEPLAYHMETHNASDNSTYQHERQRTQMLVFYETGKPAQILCTRFDQKLMSAGVASRSASGVMVIAGLMIAVVGQMVW